MRDGFAWATGGQFTGEVQRLMTMTIPGKPTSSKQKWRLTPKGRDFVAKLAKEAGSGEK